ncbi:MAG: hypothetical protein J1E96_06265 [Ruminococcus sp.]|nr:hypothetical protein [Ruminococcus sp.]
MTTIQKYDYIFSVDIEKTKEYYKTHSLCECEYCRNYYAQIKGKFPKLDTFLSEFGIDVSRPDEICSVEMDNHIDYFNVDYTVCGKIIEMGEFEIDIYDNLFLSVIITNEFASPNEQTGEYFTISVMQIKLPWVLEEPLYKPLKDKQIKKQKTNHKSFVSQNHPNIHKSLSNCYNNIMTKVSNNCGITNFIENKEYIAFSGSAQNPNLVLSLSMMKTNGEHYIYADLDDEVSWQEGDFNNQDEFENAIVEYVSPLINRTIKTVTEKKKHSFIKTSRYYLSDSDNWILIDEEVVDYFFIKLFTFKDSIKEDIKVYQLQ